MMAGPYNRFPGYDASYQIDPAALALVQIDNPTTLPAPVQVHASGAYTLTLDATQLVWCEAATTLALPTPTASWTYRIVVQVVTGGNAVTLPTVPWRGGVVPKLADANPWLIQRLQIDWDGSAWTGSWTALDVDYPIDAIAGPPAGMLVGAGTTGPLAGFTTGGPRMLYAVTNATPPFSSWSAVAQLGNGTNSRVIIQNVGGTSNILSTLYFPSGDNNQSVPSVPISAGKIALSVSVDTDGTVAFTVLGGGTTSRTFNTGSGLLDAPVLSLFSGNTAGTPLLAAAYPAVHTAFQRTAIMQKLTRMAA